MELLAAVCKNDTLRNLTHVSVGKFVLDRIFVCDKHKILFCQTPKVGNTQWKKVLIVLNGRSLRQRAAPPALLSWPMPDVVPLWQESSPAWRRSRRTSSTTTRRTACPASRLCRRGRSLTGLEDAISKSSLHSSFYPSFFSSDHFLLRSFPQCGSRKGVVFYVLNQSAGNSCESNASVQQKHLLK